MEGVLWCVCVCVCVLDEWARPIFGLASDFKSMTRDEREERDYANLSQEARCRIRYCNSLRSYLHNMHSQHFRYAVSALWFALSALFYHCSSGERRPSQDDDTEQ